MKFNLLTAFSLLSAVASATTCYDTQGNVDPVFEVCNSTLATSTCCHTADFCMTNGLCLNAGGNNLLGVQGCTDKNWGAPCKKYCTATSAQYSSNVFACAAPGFEPAWCCGPNSTDCCNNGSGFTIPVGKIFLRDSQTNTSSTSSTSPTSATNNPSTTLSNSVLTTPSSSIATSSIPVPSSTPSSTPSSNKSLSIGLGVGIPLGIIVTAVLAFLSWELRRYNNTQAQKHVSVPVPVYSNQVRDLKVGQVTELQAPCGSELDDRNQIYELPHTQRHRSR